MDRQILVIGGGITGRLAGHVITDAQIFDWGPPPRTAGSGLTRSFGTNYLWEPIGGLECRSFQVITEVDGQEANEDSVARYKAKIGKGYDMAWGDQFLNVSVGYDLVQQPDVQVQYNKRAVSINPDKRRVVWGDGRVTPYDVLLSTIPLYALIGLLREHVLGETLLRNIGSAFKFDPIFVRVSPRPLDAKYPPETVYVNYLSDPRVPAYRICDRDGSRHYESLTGGGVIPTKKIVPGKIHPIDRASLESAHTALSSYGIRCFGRFAAWNPNELVHQTYHQILNFYKEVLA
jgi:hypothetical protein